VTPPNGVTIGPTDPEEPLVDLLETSAAGPAAIRGSALRALGYGGGLLLALAAAPLIFRHLGVVEYGRYAAVLSLITLAAGFSEGGLNAIAVREWATVSPGRRERLFANLLGIRIVLTVITVVLAVGFAMAAGYEAALVIGTALAGVGMLGQSVQTLLASPLQADLRFGWATTAELLRQTIFVAATIGLVLAGAGVLPLLAAQIPGAFAALALIVVLIRGRVPLRPRTERAIWRPLLKDTLPYAIAIAINAAYFRIALLVMSIAATGLQTGYFAASFRIVEVLIAVPPVILAAAFPILSRAARDDAQRFSYAAGRLLEVALIAGGLCVVATELGAPLAVRLLAGPDYEAAVSVLRIQAPAVLATFATVACAYPLLSLHRHREIMLANLLALAAVIIALALLVGPYAARGAAVATLTAEFVLLLAVAYFLRRARAGVPLAGLTVLWVAIAMVAGILAGLIPGLPELVSIAVGVVAYLAVLLAAGRIPPELLDAVRR
jgi:O-antigen/teichoic acid export membrane protein